MATFLATWDKPGEPAVIEAWRRYSEGGDLLDCLEGGLMVCEMDPEFLAIGLGSLPNADGEIELDAAIMDGADLSCGAVCALQDIVPAISVARKVKEDTIHNMIAGSQARRFAIEKGFVPQNLSTAEMLGKYAEWRAGKTPDEYIHSTSDLHGDTVTMLGKVGNRFAAASSTSGWAWKVPGRVGDSPIVGAGIYADNEAGCAGATGLGEELWKACASFRAVECMRRGMTAQEACEDTVRQMIRRQPNSCSMPCVVLAIDNAGGYGAALTVGEFDLWSCVDGVVETKKFVGLADRS